MSAGRFGQSGVLQIPVSVQDSIAAARTLYTDGLDRSEPAMVGCRAVCFVVGRVVHGQFPRTQRGTSGGRQCSWSRLPWELGARGAHRIWAYCRPQHASVHRKIHVRPVATQQWLVS